MIKDKELFNFIAHVGGNATDDPELKRYIAIGLMLDGDETVITAIADNASKAEELRYPSKVLFFLCNDFADLMEVYHQKRYLDLTTNIAPLMKGYEAGGIDYLMGFIQ